MRKLIRYVILGTICLGAILWFVFRERKVTYTPKGELTETMVKQAFETLNNSLSDRQRRYTYFDYIDNYTIDYSLTDHDATLISSDKTYDKEYGSYTITLGQNESATYTVTVNGTGLYHLLIDYQTAKEALVDYTIALKINGEYPFDESKVINLPKHWKDETKNFVKDRFGDETLPTQIQVEGWLTNYFYNNTYYTVLPLLFYFESGTNTIDITNVTSNPIKLGNLKLIAPKEIPTYQQYRKNYALKDDYEAYVNAISYVEKNSSYVRMDYMRDPSLTPFNAVDKVLNIITSESWKHAGQELVYEFEVPETGNYKLAFYYQNTKNDFSVFRTIRIDGEIPFREMMAYEFPTTKGNKWRLEVLSDPQGKPYEFYLTAGKHQLSIRADQEPVARSIRNLQLILDHLNKFTLDIIKITGRDIDKNRTWDFTRYIPETDKYLESYEILLKDIIANLRQYSINKEASSTLAYIQKALYMLNKLRKDPDDLPLYLENLSTGSGSVAQMLGDSITMLREQPLALDGFFISNKERINEPKVNVFRKSWASIRAFFASFNSDKYNVRVSEDVVDVWVNKPITYVDIMQKMVESDFTPKTGIKVNISVMPDPNKLILAAAANEAPDVALGLPSYMPFDFAIRNASYDLTQFDDFWEFAGNFAPGAFVPYVLNDGVYALPETLDFNAIIYRKDTFEALGLEVPDTWDEILGILPVLQRYGMNFYHPIAGGASTKWFYQTTPFIYQYGGDIYSEDGLSTTIDSPEASRGLQFLTSLFRSYSLPEQVGSFYNSFRYNELPIGIVDFTNYLQIKNAAPELIGQWALSDNPGTVRPNGTIDRSYIANGTAGIILKGGKKVEESWEFLKWWMSEEVQTTFAFTLQSTYGPEYVWLSGNIEAVKNSPIEAHDKEIILRQIEWLVDVPRTPGQYMLERGLSDIWNKAVYDGVATGVAIDNQVVVINREIKRKMIEFGFLDPQGNVIKEYRIRDVHWVREQIEKARREGK